VEGFDYRRDVAVFGDFDDSTSESILNSFESFYLDHPMFWKIELQ